MTADVTLK